MLLELRRLEVPPGQRLLLRDVTWQEFETILDELGDHRSARLAYENGTLEMMIALNDSVGSRTKETGRIVMSASRGDGTAW